MTSEERVLKVFQFQTPDRIPTYDNFWEFPEAWRKVWEDPGVLTDIQRYIPEERAFPTRKKILKEEDGWITEVDGWGRTIRHKPETFFVETLNLPFPVDQDPDTAQFDPPDQESRYYGSGTQADLDKKINDLRSRYYVYVKTGGPFLRTTNVRGETQFLMDMAADPPLARAWADKVAAHIAAVGVEALSRSGLQENGIWIFDDMGTNKGPFFSPDTFEKVLLPGYRHMVKTYREAGARYVLLHSFAHILMRQLVLECGYTGASVRERIYSRDPNADPERPEPLAGILIYTAAPDSEGTLGGLVSLGEPQELSRHICSALRDAALCASDPLCAEHLPSQRGITLHAAACHACLFAPETSCERGNRYLDRSVLVPTVEREDLFFFPENLYG